jgi:hypothetical protein
MDRVGENTELYHGDYTWEREEENFSAVDSYSTHNTDVPLTDVAGTEESLAQKFAYTTANARVTQLTVRLKRTGVLTGQYRLAIFNDDGSGKPGVRLHTTAWQDASAVPTAAGGTDIAIAVDYDIVSTNTYFLVVETDSTYKGEYSFGSKELIWRSDNTTGTNEAFSLDASTWSAIATTTMYFEVYAGVEDFTAVASKADMTTTTELNITNEQELSQAFTLSDATVIKRVRLETNRTATIPDGGFYVAIIRDAAVPGTPSLSGEDKIAESEYFPMSNVPNGNGQTVVDIPSTPLPAGTYHIVLRTDAAYKADFSTGTRALSWRADGATYTTQGKRRAAGAWNALATPMEFSYDVYGRELDLRVRITGSQSALTNRLLDGYGLFYDREVIGVSNGVKHLQVEQFKAVADNFNEFELTWAPDPDTVEVIYVEAGQIFVWRNFQIDGKKIVFPQNFFYNSGVEADVTLVIRQFAGNSFDNSDQNASLLAANHLGSTDPSISRAQPGRGIILERPDGTIRELTIDDDDNVAIFSV